MSSFLYLYSPLWYSHSYTKLTATITGSFFGSPVLLIIGTIYCYFLSACFLRNFKVQKNRLLRACPETNQLFFYSFAAIFRIALRMTSIKLAIFDLDGTLYNQKALRKKYFPVLLFSLLTNRMSLKQFFILRAFRIWREAHKGYSALDLDQHQFEKFAAKQNLSRNFTEQTIVKWMYEKPLPYLKNCIYPGCPDFFEFLRSKGIKIAVFSDYPIENKLEMLGLKSDFNLCSTDAAVNQFKPNAAGLNKICQYFKIKPEESVYFGDREDTDGKSATLAGIKFIKVNRQEAASRAFFKQQIEYFS